MCSARDKRLTIEHFLFTCSDFIQRRESQMEDEGGEHRQTSGVGEMELEEIG